MRRSLKNLRPTDDRVNVIRQPSGRLVYDWDEWDELIYYILDIFVDPTKRRRGIAKKMLETLFRRAKRDEAVVSPGIISADGKNLIPNLVYFATKYEVRVIDDIEP